MARVLVIGDLHLPATHPDYLEFCRALRRKYKTDTTVFIGDVLDHHTISFHKRHPDAPGAIYEYEQAQAGVSAWKRAFPTATVTIGNHDERVHRLSADVGIPSMYLRDYSEIYNTPGWDWVYKHEIDNVYYTHGTGCGGQYAAFNAAKQRACSTVMGHIHSAASINWTVGPTTRLFGMQVGTGVDLSHVFMSYGTNFLRKPVVSAAVVVDGHPYLELMAL